ncbi:MAG: GGDEF domain-containing protein [Aquabacterium sp.]|uniref:GGDEF domain-containing protein n=1 Tax=Aquabacterium sp. TaxID=1872578 RepID=UPI0025C07B86|nr:GGDEF domain-containing protein [Aquabacterium sp.]MBI5925181.1 GGDEF domain-containing protein [Aquabacterium sp.]
MTMPQLMVAVSFAAWIYSLGGYLRDAILLVVCPLLAWGFHFLRARQIRLVSLYALASLGSAMVYLMLWRAGQYDMGGELLRFMLLALVIFLIWQSTQDRGDDEDSWLERLLTLVLTGDPKQRLRLQRFLVAATNFAICTVVLLYAIRTGAVDRQAGAMLSAYMTTQSVLFYVVLRSGLNLRFPDPSLTFPQIIVAITCVVGSYAILRDSRGASLMLLVMVLVFGMFNLTARQARFASLFALSLQGAAMWGLVHWQPGYFTPRQELIHFLFACTVLPTISLLSGQLSDLRERLRQRKDDLTLALERIQTLATRDELTGLYNRRHMMDVLVQQAKVADGGGRVFCVVLIDIDLFKSVNDMHGHGVGDEVLRHFAQLVQNAIGSSDYFARWGGEEFLLVLTDCRLAHAQACLQRIHRVINDASLSKSMPTLKVTFSAGVTERVCGEASEAVIERADRGLYRAKQTGRDKTYAVA